MTIIKIIVKSLKGELIKDATVNMIPTKDGIYTEQYNTGKNHFHVEANGYVGNDFNIDVHEEMQIEKDVILLEVNPKEKEIPLLDKSMNINLTSFLIDKFPYLNDIVYDIINHKYEKVMNNSDINYQELVSDLEKKYHIQIVIMNKLQCMFSKTIL